MNCSGDLLWPVLRDIMSNGIVSVSAEISLYDAAMFIEHRQVTALLVTRAGAAVGMITQRDLVHTLAEGRDITAPVSTVMSFPLITLPLDTGLHAGFRFMRERQIRHLLVADDTGLPVGMVGLVHLRRHGLWPPADQLAVAQAMNPAPLCLDVTTTAAQAAAIMWREGAHYAVVAEPSGKPRALVTEGDLARLFRDARGGEKLVKAIAPGWQHIDTQATLGTARALMERTGGRVLLATAPDGTLRGALDELDWLTCAAKSRQEAVQRQAEEQARRLADSGMLGLINQLPQRVMIKDINGVYIGASQSVADDLGLRLDEIVGKSSDDLLPTSMAAGYAADDRRVLSNQEVLSAEHPFSHGALHGWVRTTRKPLLDPQGKVTGMVILYENITADRTSREEMRRRNWALTALNRASRALLDATSEQDLLMTVCAAVTMEDVYPLSWFGRITDDAASGVDVAAVAGAASLYMDSLPIAWRNDGVSSRGPFGRAITTQCTVAENDLANSADFAPWRDRAGQFGLAASLVVPLRSAGRVTGALVVYSRSKDSFGPNEVALFEEFAATLQFGIESRRIATALEQAHCASREHDAALRHALEDALAAMGAVLEQRDPYTAGHEKNVAGLAVQIGREMGLPEEALHALHLACIVHDLGKIDIPVEILTKPGRLSVAEFALIKRHPEVGYNLLRKIEFPWPIADIIRQHHEYLDGSGYPHGLKGDQIMREARILTVADIVEAISADRPYRAALGLDVAVQEIKRLRTIKLDPEAVDACVAVIARGDFVPVPL